MIGTITVRPEGYGFLKRLEGPPGDDVFLPPDQLRGVMDGDRLRIELVRGRYGRDAGVLVDVLDRRRRHLVGTYFSRGNAYVVPVDPTLPRSVPVRRARDVRDGQVVKVEITQYPEPGIPLLGEVLKVIGEPGDPIVEVLEVAYSNGFAEDFPADVRTEAAKIPDHVTAEEKAGRRDLTGLRLVTIDSEDARDFDDAVFVEPKGDGGYRLVVAIADVAHYVRPGTRLDEEALARATSVYFPNHVLPMLPERLSNGICSLNPQVDRLCMVCDITFDATGKPLEAEVYDGVMWSHARCTYTKVAQILDGGDVPDLAHVKEDLLLAGELARKLRQRRVERGSLDFDIPEVKPVLDENMHVKEIARRERNDAHRLVEEFMLAANEAVARHFANRGLPSVYRVHAQPDPEKLQLFANLADAVGFHFDVEEGGITPLRLGEWLRAVEGSPQQKALNTLMLRAMMQAIYSPENIGHFGLGAEHYLHFTSPIRRYPDLIVHRLLKEHWARGGHVPAGPELERMEELLADLAAQSSSRERAAMEAEREIDSYFKCLYVEDKVGEVHDATIVSVTDFGFFCELDPFPVDGLVRAEELGTAWEFDDQRYRLVFPGSGLSFGIGEKVKVEIAGVDLKKRQIGFVLVADQSGEEVLPVGVRAPQGRFGRPRPEEGAGDRWGRAMDAWKSRGRGGAPQEPWRQQRGGRGPEREGRGPEREGRGERGGRGRGEGEARGERGFGRGERERPGRAPGRAEPRAFGGGEHGVGRFPRERGPGSFEGGPRRGGAAAEERGEGGTQAGGAWGTWTPGGGSRGRFAPTRDSWGGGKKRPPRGEAAGAPRGEGGFPARGERGEGRFAKPERTGFEGPGRGRGGRGKGGGKKRPGRKERESKRRR